MNEKTMKAILSEYEKKLVELMGKEKFIKFSTKIAKTIFLAEIQSMPDGDFKDFCIKNFTKVTNEVDELFKEIYGDD